MIFMYFFKHKHTPYATMLINQRNNYLELRNEFRNDCAKCVTKRATSVKLLKYIAGQSTFSFSSTVPRVTIPSIIYLT